MELFALGQVSRLVGWGCVCDYPIASEHSPNSNAGTAGANIDAGRCHLVPSRYGTPSILLTVNFSLLSGRCEVGSGLPSHHPLSHFHSTASTHGGALGGALAFIMW